MKNQRAAGALARTTIGCLGLLALLHTLSPVQATTKGLNQIVTPDLQPVGQLSLSYQQQDPVIGNPSEVQLELGVNRRFEFAIFQGLHPNETVFNAEFGLVQHLPYLLSAGFGNWDVRGRPPQPYVEGGYYVGKHRISVGGARVGTNYEALLGWAYQLNPRFLLQLDYQSGPGNAASAGFNYVITPPLQFNPAIYVSNDDHSLHGYAVLTWNVQVF